MSRTRAALALALVATVTLGAVTLPLGVWNMATFLVTIAVVGLLAILSLSPLVDARHARTDSTWRDRGKRARRLVRSNLRSLICAIGFVVCGCIALAQVKTSSEFDATALFFGVGMLALGLLWALLWWNDA